MEYKKYEYPSFNIYTVKTNRFKTCEMQIAFKSEARKEEMLPYTFLADLMSDCGSIYNSRREVAKKLEELYQASFYGITNKAGNLALTSFILSFLNPRYVKDKNYLEEVLKLPFDMILNPKIDSGEFDIKNFNIVKNRLHDEILGVSENINSTALKKALATLDKSSPSSFSVLGTISDLEDITPKSLSKNYQKLMSSACDIYIVGNFDMDKLANIIAKNFKRRVINTENIPLYVENKIPRRERKVLEKSKFLETNLINIYNLDGLNKKEKTTVMHFYNYLLGGGGLNTKLYQLLREKNSLCYGIKSMYLKYDNLLVIQTSISKNDVAKANRLIKKAFKEMKNGEFSAEELEAAKENFIFSLNLSLDNPGGILNNYLFHILDDLPLIEERIKMVKDITKEEIVNISSKIKPNISFVLEGEENNGNN